MPKNRIAKNGRDKPKLVISESKKVWFTRSSTGAEALVLTATLAGVAVAKAAMEVGVSVETENLFTGETKNTASAFLTYVALDKSGKPTEIAPLILETEDDKLRNREAQARRENRLKQAGK